MLGNAQRGPPQGMWEIGNCSKHMYACIFKVIAPKPPPPYHGIAVTKHFVRHTIIVRAAVVARCVALQPTPVSIGALLGATGSAGATTTTSVVLEGLVLGDLGGPRTITLGGGVVVRGGCTK